MGKKIKELGIDSINGKVIADASCFSVQNTPSTWVWGDLGNYYGASPSGLSIYENMCKVEFVSGSEKGDSTIVSCVNPYIPDFEINNSVISANTTKDESYFLELLTNPIGWLKVQFQLKKKILK